MVDIDIHNNPIDFKFFLQANVLERDKKALDLSDKEEYNEALEIYDNIIRGITAHLDSLYANRGYVLYEMGDKDGAIADFKKAIAINNENELALDGLLTVLKEKENNDE